MKGEDAGSDGLAPVMDARRAVEGASALYKATVEVARRHGYSVQEIADAAGVSRQAIYALLRESAELREREPLPALDVLRRATAATDSA